MEEEDACTSVHPWLKRCIRRIFVTLCFMNQEGWNEDAQKKRLVKEEDKLLERSEKAMNLILSTWEIMC